MSTSFVRFAAARDRLRAQPLLTHALALGLGLAAILLVRWGTSVVVFPIGLVPVWTVATVLGSRHGALAGVLFSGSVLGLTSAAGWDGLIEPGSPAALLGVSVLVVEGVLVGRWSETERALRRELAHRDELEQRLRRRDASLSQLLSNLPAVVWVTDPDLRVTFADGQGFANQGIDPSTLIGRDLRDVTDLLAGLVEPHVEVLSGGRADPVEMQVGADTFEAHVVGLEGRDGTDAVIGIAIDVSDRVAAQDSLTATLERERELSAQLRHVDEVKNSFLQAVSHELRTPLTALSGFAATLQRAEARLTADQRAMVLDRIRGNAEKLDRLLSDLLDIDRLSRGVIKPQRAFTDVSALVLSLLDETDLGAHPLSTRIEPTTAFVDAAKVERVVENLLHNAARHTSQTTPLTIHVRRREGGVYLGVEQDGFPVSDELKDSIFQAFAQGPRARGSATPGTGIGLALVTRFAELHGGRAWVEDTDNGGAIFAVHLPDETSVPSGVVVSQSARPRHGGTQELPQMTVERPPVETSQAAEA